MDRKTLPTDALSTLEAAIAADCHPSTIERRIATGELPATRIFNRWVIRRVDLDSWLTREADRGRKVSK